MELFTTFSVALVIIGAAAVASWVTKGVKGRLPPGPSGFNFYRDFLKAVVSQTTYLQFGKWAKEYGEMFYLSLPRQKIIVINSVDALRQIFNGPTKNITNDRPPSFLGKYLFLDCGITFSPAEKLWKRLRQLFHTSINMHVDGGRKIEETLRLELVSTVAQLQATGTAEHVDICDMASHYLMTVLHILITGERPAKDSPNLQLMKDIDYHMNKSLALDQEAVLVNFPFLRHFPNSYGRRWSKLVVLRKQITDIFFKEFHTNFKNGEEGVINKYLEAMMTDKEIVSENQVRVVIIELIAAGYVTSKATLTALILLILHKPEVQKKLHEEIEHVLGGRPPGIKDQYNMPYFGAFFLEIMRFTSLLPTGFPHMVTEDFDYKDWHIPKDTVILGNLFFMNHDENIWDDPWDFKPERFLQDDGQLVDPLSDVRKRIMSFGVGKRSCPGEGFAKSRIFMFVVTLFQQFEFLPPEDEPLPSWNPRDWEPGLILMADNFRCRVKRRHEAQADGSECNQSSSSTGSDCSCPGYRAG